MSEAWKAKLLLGKLEGRDGTSLKETERAPALHRALGKSELAGRANHAARSDNSLAGRRRYGETRDPRSHARSTPLIAQRLPR